MTGVESEDGQASQGRESVRVRPNVIVIVREDGRKKEEVRIEKMMMKKD